MAKHRRSISGYTITELMSAAVISGALAASAAPSYLRSVERAKAAEAFTYLATIHGTMEHYRAVRGTYANDVEQLDITFTELAYFSIGDVRVPPGVTSLEMGWMIVLTRSGPSGGFGEYTVVFSQDGMDKSWSTIPAEISPNE